MSIWFSGFICSFMFSLAYSYMFNNLINEEKYWYKKIFLYVMLSILTCFVFCLKTGIRSTIMFMSVLILLKFIYKKNWFKTVVTTFLIHILCALSEIIVAVILVGIFRLELDSFTSTSLGILIVNFLVLFVSILVFNIPFLKKLMIYIIKWYETKNFSSLVVTVFVACITILVLLYKNISGFNNFLEFLVNNIFVVGIIYFVVRFLIEKTSNTKIRNKYNQLLSYAKTYEHEVVEKSKWQHEYENQLIIIRDKIDPKNKDAINYINNLLKNKPSNENTRWLIKLSKFPDIGIKGLLHYKICEMVKNGIKVYVDVIDEKSIPKELPKKHLEDNLQDISMALGVYLDNAMQAAMESDNKYLIVEFKCDKEQITIQISNTYKGKVQLDKINQERYTTKGSNHGYGLSIVKDIMNRNKYLSQEREMNGMYYVQKLLIDLKK